MFRMNFDRNMLENVKEHFSIWVYACAGIDLGTQLVFLLTQDIFMHTHPCSLVYKDT